MRQELSLKVDKTEQDKNRAGQIAISGKSVYILRRNSIGKSAFFHPQKYLNLNGVKIAMR